MKVLVLVREYEGRAAGAIMGNPVEESQIYGTFLTSDKWAEWIEVPNGADKNFLQTALIAATEEVPEHWEISENTSTKFVSEKAAKLLAIDMKTNGLISQGATFDSVVFSLSANAQLTWLGLLAKESSFTWPKEISTRSNGAYSLAQADLADFTDAMAGTVASYLDSGRALKVSVNAAANLTALNAIVDAR